MFQLKINTPAAIRQLIQIHGSDTTLGDVIWKLQKDMPHVCIKCNGKGYITKRINNYPIGLPDSGWVDRFVESKATCDLCHGLGNTKDEYEAKPTHIEYVKKH